MLICIILVCVVVTGAVGGMLYFNSIAVFNSPRYMELPLETLLRDSDYVRRLPGLLMQLREAGFASAWPTRAAALAVHAWRTRICHVSRALRHAQGLVGQHLALWAFLQEHREELDRLIVQLKRTRARQVLAHSPIPEERDRALEFLASNKPARKPRGAPRGTPGAPWLGILRNLSAVFSEHGYELDPRVSTLIFLESADRRAFLDELVHVAPKIE